MHYAGSLIPMVHRLALRYRGISVTCCHGGLGTMTLQIKFSTETFLALRWHRPTTSLTCDAAFYSEKVRRVQAGQVSYGCSQHINNLLMIGWKR